MSFRCFRFRQQNKRAKTIRATAATGTTTATAILPPGDIPEVLVASAPDVERAAAPEDVDDDECVEDEELEDVTEGKRGSDCVDVWVIVTG